MNKVIQKILTDSSVRTSENAENAALAEGSFEPWSGGAKNG
jgi:hypothetical protein